jgi:hypothetical protein
MSKRRIIGIIGVAVLTIGVFLPFVDFPVVGSKSYLQNGKGDGALMLVIAAVSLFLILSKNTRALMFTGLASLGTLIYTYVDFHRTLSGMKLESLANLFSESVGFRWGSAVIIMGAFLLLAAAWKPGGAETPDSRGANNRERS